ncbi:MAG TPA: Ig-like domain-containing protein [Tepidiformaceae bacterium]
MKTRRLRLRIGACLVAAAVAALASVGGVSAAGTQQATLVVTAPATANLGDQVTVTAKLTSAAGSLVKETVQFAIPTTFLNGSGDMVVAQAVTDGQGQASATFEARSTGALQLKGVFAGDNTYAPVTAAASSTMTVTGNQQLYVPDIGIALRGLNTTPTGQATGFAHWFLSGWPIGAVLTLIWSMYATAVYFMSRVVAEGERATEVQS